MQREHGADGGRVAGGHEGTIGLAKDDAGATPEEAAAIRSTVAHAGEVLAASAPVRLVAQPDVLFADGLSLAPDGVHDGALSIARQEWLRQVCREAGPFAIPDTPSPALFVDFVGIFSGTGDAVGEEMEPRRWSRRVSGGARHREEGRRGGCRARGSTAFIGPGPI